MVLTVFHFFVTVPADVASPESGSKCRCIPLLLLGEGTVCSVLMMQDVSLLGASSRCKLTLCWVSGLGLSCLTTMLYLLSVKHLAKGKIFRLQVPCCIGEHCVIFSADAKGA